jgi:nucleoside-diphosphate-sugar epimerase
LHLGGRRREVFLGAGATVLRLPMTGPHDYQRREEPVLRRVRAGRRLIPVGVSNALLPVALVADVARGVVAAAERVTGCAEVYNLAAEPADPMAVRMRRILDAAQSDAELVRVPEGTPLPDDLQITAAVSQALVVSAAKARRDLGYRDTEPRLAVGQTVRWHLAHPPERADSDFSDDDRALRAAT